MTNSTAPFSNLSGKTLRRSRNQRMLSGVSGGLAEYFGLDVTLIRLVIVGLTLITGGGALLGYVVAWIVMPEADGKAVWQSVQQSTNGQTQQPTPESDIAARIYDDKPPHGRDGRHTAASRRRHQIGQPAPRTCCRVHRSRFDTLLRCRPNRASSTVRSAPMQFPPTSGT